MPNSKLGDRIKKFRDIKRISIEDLSERSGLEVDLLRDIEENITIPQLGTILKISRAMGIRMANFMDDSVAADPIIVRAGDSAASVEAEIGPGRDAPQSLVFHPLGKGKIDRHMEPFLIDVLPQPPGQVKVAHHEGEEFIVVLSGEIELQYGKDTYRMKAGDSVYYSSNVPHRLVALNEEIAKIVAVIYFSA